MKKILFSFIALAMALPNIGLANELNDPDIDCPASSSYTVPLVSVEEQDDGVLVSWDKISDQYFVGYKVVISEDDSTPSYPSNGYLKYITDANVTSLLVDNSTAYINGDFGSYLEDGEDYYFSVTALYKCNNDRSEIAGNVVEASYNGQSNDSDDDSDHEDGDSDDSDVDGDEDSSDDDTSNVAPPTPEVSLTSNEDGVLLSWKKIDDDRFSGYKIVASKNNSKPAYPNDGYLKYITDDDTTAYLIDNSSAYRNGDFGSYFKVDENYYFSITALYSGYKVAGNVVEATYEGPETNENTKPITVDPIVKMEERARKLNGDELGDILSELQKLRDIVQEQQNEIKYLRSLVNDMSAVNQKVLDALSQFITYGVDENTEKLGEGERAAVIHSYKAAYDKLPESDDEMADAIKIANGRWPSQTNEQAEVRAKTEFRKIYLREADMSNPNDNAAVTIMAYGLRQRAENRNLDSERQGIKTCQYIYGHTPQTTEEWNAMQAITYSGATR
ncbi:hypothetical protein C0580_00965 [Candidatus Parcubacteria bacterium]|nr:MAG: hypothetical protein C0580_00965 [Candidatus Parcubacteria bacterium]